MPEIIKAAITAVIIPAGGSGTRMKSKVPKQFLFLEGQPVLIRTARAFLEQKAIRHVAIAVPSQHTEETEKLLKTFIPEHLLDKIIIAPGGATRQDSVFSGLQSLPEEVEFVLVHDGARPMVSAEIINRCLEGVQRHGAVIAGVAVKDTIKKLSKNNLITRTIDRNNLWHAQTPQAAKKELLLQAYKKAHQDNFVGTDEASLLEHAGIQVTLVKGSEKNIKITRPDDLKLIAGILETDKAMRIGHGYDVHQLVPNRDLVLGGVTIPYELGLLGHSDADVLTHALIDAIIGALGEGDIGKHFPDSDEKFNNIDSLKLLKHIFTIVTQKNMCLGNADITIICQKPKLASHIEQMRKNIASICKVTNNSINIKATTTEHLGFTGRSEGISAHAVVLLSHN